MLPCQHTFHAECFGRVTEGICPLCRFNVAESRAECADCGHTSDLWMCLVCGGVRCGQYSNHHATHHHSLHPSHGFAMQVGGLRVWDFTARTFVHRVVASLEGDELATDLAMKPGAAATGAGPSAATTGGGGGTPLNNGNGHTPAAPRPLWSAMAEEDDDAELFTFQAHVNLVADFYSGLLQRQLEAQRDHFAAQSTKASAHALETHAALAETDGRRRVVLECARAYTSLMRDARDGLAAPTLQRQRRAKAATAELADVEATVAQLRGNVAQLESLKAALGAKGGAAAVGGAAELVAERDALQRELELLYAQL